MQSIGLKILVALLVVLTIVGFAVYLPKDEPALPFGEDDPDALTSVGQLAPDFETTTIEGRKIRLSELRGKVVFVAFFATWCPP
ncbi:MAG: redoxin domain-containing protein, partial [Planctomycetota bacterium]